MNNIKHVIRKSDTLLSLVRTLKSIPSNYRNTASQLRLERAADQLIQHREKGTREYFSAYKVHKLQIGSGENMIEGWLNTDLEPTSEEVYYLNVLEKFPFNDNSFDFIYTEHMIEHITYPQCLNMFKEVFRVLKPGGVLRVATPNVERIIALFCKNKTEEQKRYIEWSATIVIGLYSEDQSRLQKLRPEWDIDHQYILRYFPNISEDSVCFIVNNFFRSYGHRFLFDSNTLKATLVSVGFIELTQHEIGESDNEHLIGLETHGKVIGISPNRYETLIMQGRKPGNQISN